MDHLTPDSIYYYDKEDDFPGDSGQKLPLDLDKLTLKGLRYRGLHGVHEHERVEGNDFEVDLIFFCDLRSAGQSDELSKTVDYEIAENLVSEIMLGPSKKLIESLCLSIGESLMKHFAMAIALRVIVRKLAPPVKQAAEYSEVCMNWRRG
ncbi:MAG: dihydroneopterin aldolase [Bacteroidetes bacterium]|jgi:dihydroneopterin aldolase|nr:dihydroneopterin aldolase [Bacteroidota bacterium]